jgi:hypothetical protein
MIQINDNKIQKDGKDITFPIDAGGRNVSLITGIGDDEQIRFIGVTSDGKLKVDASVSVGNITIGDVNIRAMDPSNTARNLGAIQNQDLTWSLKVRDVGLSFDNNNLLVAPMGFDGSTYRKIKTDSSGAIYANIANSPDVYNNIKTYKIDQILFNTSDSYNTIVTIDTRYFKTKTLFIKNTGYNNSANIRILGSVDGAYFDFILANDVKIDPQNSYIFKDDSALMSIKIEAKNYSSGLSTTIITKGYMINI